MDRETIEKINPEIEGIGRTGETMRNGKSSPHAKVNGKKLYTRIFIKLRTPQETLTCSPIKDGYDFAQRVSIIENWFNSVVRKGNYLLEFSALQVTDKEAEQILLNSQSYDTRND